MSPVSPPQRWSYSLSAKHPGAEHRQSNFAINFFFEIMPDVLNVIQVV